MTFKFYGNLLILTSSLCLSDQARALHLDDLRGGSRMEIRSSSGLAELCVVPKRWPGAAYSTSDVEKERELCSYNFYTNVGLCPKLTSTNPAIMILKPNSKHSKQAIDASNCDLKKMDVKTEAKFKQSISCSYTPSILGYYVMSRILGNVGRVPVTVLRTMDRRIHEALTKKAVTRLAGTGYEIERTWNVFAKVHLSPQNFPNVVDTSLSQIYGGLSDNIKNEEYYSEVNGKGPYETRYERFTQQPPFLRVANPLPLSQTLPTREFTQVAQTILQMKDVADLVLLDTLMNQQDRIGNIHYKVYWYYLNPAIPTKLDRLKSDAKWVNGAWSIPPAEAKAMEGRQAVLVKEMLLKDNDCGIIKSNMMRKVNALEQVSHFSKLTYRRFMDFAGRIHDPTAKAFFMQELLFTESDYAVLIANSLKAKEILQTKCRTGQLHFDVDVEEYTPVGRPLPISCE